jgi:hypothetical protein
VGAVDAAPTELSRLTILRAPGRHLTKSYGRDRNDKIIKRSYDNPKWFHAEVREFNGIDGLADQLRSLQGQTDRCVIRALPGGHFPEDGKPVRRLLHPEEEVVDGRGNFHPVAIDPAARARQEADIAAERLFPVCAVPMFEEQPSSWLLLDIDKIMAPAGVEWRKDPAWTAQFLRMQLPAEFHNVRCCYYATSSAVDPTKPDLGGPEIKMRLGFCLDRGVTAVEGKRWLRDTGLDTCTLNPVQIIYTARPVFSGGLVDPMAVRLGVLDGDHDLVAVPQINVPQHQEFKRTVFGPARSAEGLGLKPSPGLDAALERLGESEGVRDKLLAAAFAYARDVGRDRVDVAALVAALAEAAAPYRSSAEIDGYGLPGMIAWVLQRAQEPISGGLDAYFQGGDTDPAEASATLTLAVSEWVEQGLSYAGKGAAPRHAIAGAAGLGKTTVTLKVLADMAQGRTIHYYSPRLDLGDEVVAIARSEGLDAVLIRGREGSDKQPERFPPLCLRLDVVKALARAGQPVWQSACRNVDEDGTVNQCGDFGRCGYPRQFDGLEGKLIVLAHEWLTLPKTLLPKADLVIIDERFHTTVVAHTDLPLSRVASPRPIPLGGGHFRQLSADAARAIAAVEAGKTMAEIGLSPERLKEMAKDEVRLADPPTIKPGMDYVEQQRRARKLKETECFKLAKLWRVLAQDHDRLSQRVVVARGIEWKGELQDRVFVHKAKDLVLAKRLPVLVLDADHDPLIGAATLPTTKRIMITPRLNVEVTQVRNTVCSRNKLMKTSSRRRQILALARQEAGPGAQGSDRHVQARGPAAEGRAGRTARPQHRNRPLRRGPWAGLLEGFRQRHCSRAGADGAAGRREHSAGAVRDRP